MHEFVEQTRTSTHIYVRTHVARAREQAYGCQDIFFLTLLQFEGRFEMNSFLFGRRWRDETDENAKKYNWVKKVDIVLNGRILDCLNADARPHDNETSFLRMNQIIGNIGQST